MIPQFKIDVVQAFEDACLDAGLSKVKKSRFQKYYCGLSCEFCLEYKRLSKSFEIEIYIYELAFGGHESDAYIFTMIYSVARSRDGDRQLLTDALNPQIRTDIFVRREIIRAAIARCCATLRDILPDAETLRRYVEMYERPFPWLLPATYISLVRGSKS